MKKKQIRKNWIIISLLLESIFIGFTYRYIEYFDPIIYILFGFALIYIYHIYMKIKEKKEGEFQEDERTFQVRSYASLLSITFGFLLVFGLKMFLPELVISITHLYYILIITCLIIYFSPFFFQLSDEEE